MVLNLENLNDKEIRELMLKELEEDIKNNKIYISSRLKENCKEVYISLFMGAIQKGTADSLAQAILDKSCLKTNIIKKTPSGKLINSKMPSDAHLTLAEGEFNRFYLRALCLKVIKNGGNIQVYRAKNVKLPRPESQAMIGKIIDATELIYELRTKPGVDLALKLPNGPNSGLSGKIKN